MPSNTAIRYDVCIVGGAGHIGAPLALVFADRGLRTLILDVNGAALEEIAAGRLPFREEGGDALLARVLPTGRLGFSSDAHDVAGVPHVVVTIGTPVDEFHNPVLRVVSECIDGLLPHLGDDQTIILRSTVFPGVTDRIARRLEALGRRGGIAYCPDRVVQGHSIRELQTLPQIVSGTTPEAEESAARLFAHIAPSVVRMVPAEAEFGKLFANAYRYIQFAATNQFFMMVQAAGLDYHRLLEGLKTEYPRLADLPGPGFSAGPCLYKDTLQLAAFAQHQFGLGYAAMQVNEGLPLFIVEELAQRIALERATVGLLGMAFKADSDDVRASLSYKLKKLLEFRAAAVLTTDPHVTDDAELRPLDEVLQRSDALVICVPHAAYRALDFGNKPTVDVWNTRRSHARRSS